MTIHDHFIQEYERHSDDQRQERQASIGDDDFDVRAALVRMLVWIGSVLAAFYAGLTAGSL